MLVPESAGVLCNPRLNGLGETLESNGEKGHCSHPTMELMDTLQRDNILSELLLIYVHCVIILLLINSNALLSKSSCGIMEKKRIYANCDIIMKITFLFKRGILTKRTDQYMASFVFHGYKFKTICINDVKMPNSQRDTCFKHPTLHQPIS